MTDLPTSNTKPSLIDYLQLVAENLKLLIVSPVVAGMLAFGVTFMMPATYVSESIIGLPTSFGGQSLNPAAVVTATAQAGAVMVSPLILDSVIDLHGLAEGRTAQGARKKLLERVRTFVSKDGLLRLEVQANSPPDAQKLANAVIDAWLLTTKPAGEDRADLDKRLANAKTSLAAVERVLDKISRDDVNKLLLPVTRGENGMAIVALGELQSKYFTETLVIPRQLQGLSRDIVKQSPTLPGEPVFPKKGLVAALAFVAAEIALVAWIFLRYLWHQAGSSPDIADKQTRLRKTIGLKG